MSKTEYNTPINHFPSQTWNHLHISGSHLSNSVDSYLETTIEGPLPGGCTHKAQSYAQFQTEYGAFLSPTQIGSEADALIDTAVQNTSSVVQVFTVHAELGNESIFIPARIQGGAHSVRDIFIFAEAGTHSSFLFDFETAPQNAQEESFLLHRVRVYAQEGAHIALFFVNRLSFHTDFCNAFGSLLDTNATLELNQIELGAKSVFTGSRNVLFGRNSSVIARGAYAALKNQQRDVQYVSYHSGKESHSSALFNAVLANEGKKTWRGTIQFPKGCAGAKGAEREAVLLLSPAAENKSMPVILCDEEDVEGEHGSSIGNLSPETLLYLESRGLDEESARALMIKSHINAVALRVPHETLTEKMQQFLEEALV